MNTSSIVWLASYPKSGNTWVRAFLNRLFFDEDSLTGMNRIPKFSSRHFFPNFEDFQPEGPGAIRKHWISAQERICRMTSGISVIKTHNINAEFGEYAFTREEFTYAVIYIVRDPRDVLPSFAHHMGVSHDDALEMMLDPRQIIGTLEEPCEFLSDWGTHVRSWRSMKNRPYILIKYEDLIKSPKKSFARLTDLFAKRLSNAEMDEIIQSVSFDSLKKKEELTGFIEASENGVFFRRGKVGEWRDLDYKRYIAPLEQRFGDTMRLLGYRLAGR